MARSARKIEVIVDEIEFLTSRNDGAHVAPRHRCSRVRLWLRLCPMQQAPAPVAAPVVDASVYDDDIPF